MSSGQFIHHAPNLAKVITGIDNREFSEWSGEDLTGVYDGPYIPDGMRILYVMPFDLPSDRLDSLVINLNLGVPCERDYKDMMENPEDYSDHDLNSWPYNICKSGSHFFPDYADYDLKKGSIIPLTFVSMSSRDIYDLSDCWYFDISTNIQLKNLVDGSAIGSVKNISADANTQSYTIGSYATAFGYSTKAGGYAAHAEGYNNSAGGDYSHVEGFQNYATGDKSHAEGSSNYATGNNSHAEGVSNLASGNSSHVEGYNTIANHANQHVFGTYNVADDSTATAGSNGNYIEIVGNGTADDARSNARTLDWSGNEVLAGTLTTGTAPEAEGDTTHKVGIMIKSDIDPDTAPESSQWYRLMSIKDTDDMPRSYFGAFDMANGTQGIQIETKRMIDGEAQYNGLRLGISPTGEKVVNIHAADAWRSALDLGTNGALPITVAQGGTGVTTATKNQVFAAPNGSNGAPGFRALVAADIPTLAISKISGLDTALDDKVAIAGDTMTGNLTISKASESILYLRNTAAALGTAPGSDAYTGRLGFQTSTNVTIGWVDNHYSKNKESITRIAARNNGTGSNVDNSLSLGVANDGTRLVSMTAPAVWRTALGLGAAATRGVDTTPTSGATDLITSGGAYTALDGKVSTAGDTMTGNLTMKAASVPIRQATAKVGTTPSSTLYTGMFAAQDSAGTNIGYVRGFFGTDGATGMQFECVRAVSGSNKYHNLSLRMKADGTRQVTVTEQAPWLLGLGLAPENISSSVTKVTTMPTGISKINTLTVWRSGYLIQVYISVLPTASPPTAWVTIASGLPTPALAPIVNGRYWENSTAQPALFQVNASGQLQVAWGAGSKNQVATLVYIAKTL